MSGPSQALEFWPGDSLRQSVDLEISCLVAAVVVTRASDDGNVCSNHHQPPWTDEILR